MEQKKSKFTVEIPVRFSFVANRDIDLDTLYRIAKNSAGKKLAIAKINYNLEELDVIREEKVLTEEEIREEKNWVEEIFKKVKK